MLEDPRHLCTSLLHEGLCRGLGQWGARKKPKIGDTWQTGSPDPDAGDVGQPKENSTPRDAQSHSCSEFGPKRALWRSRGRGEGWRVRASPAGRGSRCGQDGCGLGW